MQIFVLLPAYNESENLPPLLEKFADLKNQKTVAEPVTVVLVDDGSQDGTAEAAMPFKNRLDLLLLRHSTNLGFPQALRTGLNKILDLQKNPDDVVVIMDSDNSHDPALIARMVEKIKEGNDVVIGSRYVPGGTEMGVALHRKFLSRVCGWMLRAAFHFGTLRDYTSSYRMIRLSYLRKLAEKTGGRYFQEESFVCAFEFLFNLHALGGTFSEVPLELHYDRKKGASKMNLPKTILGYLKVICKLKLQPSTQRTK